MIKKITGAAILGSMLITSVALAQGATSTTSVVRPKVDGACMASAVDRRDSAVSSDFDAFAAAIKSALSARKSALKAAWVLTDAKARRQALKDAWKAWNSASKKARMDLNKARKNAWSQFNTDRKACRDNSGNSEDQGSLGSDSNL